MSNTVEQALTEFRERESGTQKRSKIVFVLLLFLVETILQILYLAFTTKYLDQFLISVTFAKLILYAAFWVGSIKLLFFLPVYLFLHLVNLKHSVSRIRTAFCHAAVFIVIFLCIAMVWPVFAVLRIPVVLFFTGFSFATAFFLYRKTKV